MTAVFNTNTNSNNRQKGRECFDGEGVNLVWVSREA